MRIVLVLALALVLAYGVWTLLGDDEDPGAGLPAEQPKEPPRTSGSGMQPVPTTVRLVLTVRTEASTIPQGTTAGYAWGGEERLRPVDAEGRVSFTDAPTGRVTLVARAPGHEETLQQRYLSGGLPHDAILILKPRRKP